MTFKFDNTYAKELDGFYTAHQSAGAPAPKIIKVNTMLANQLGIDINSLSEQQQIAIFSGNHAPEGSAPLAQVYAGHQFGGFSQQLGDGRALLLGEVVDKNGLRFDIQLKGSGRTPYSRGGDGKSALGPVLREYIMSEAMHALNIPTTRALAAVTTGETVMRTEPTPGGVFTRIAASHIRIGTFQYFAARQEIDHIKKLADYAIERHYPKIKEELEEADNLYLSFLAQICNAQASLVAQWMCVGFIHGVMNTDNMTISGETIDYGPCAFMDHFAADTVYSSIDKQGRYAYHNQPSIAQWNLARLAEALLPLFGDETEQGVEQSIKQATEILEAFPEQYTQYWLIEMRKKLGLHSKEEEDLTLANDLLASMDTQKVDYTQLFNYLADVLQGEETLPHTLFDDATAFTLWVERWKERLERDTHNISESVELMKQVNPVYIPRNHKVEEAIEAAVVHEDYSKFEILIDTLSNPYQLQDGKDDYSQPAPKEFSASFKTFCGT
ncbi:MAG: YdiU family protein [Gammaproteobacteria bacterium]